jgi:hypothetical protein
MINKDHKLQILKENYNAEEGNKKMTLKEFVAHGAANDPNFFRWLFDAELDNDFDSSMSDEQRKEYEQFLNEL